MNYSQSANQNATNGEQDAKQIITNGITTPKENELTSLQRDELISQYSELVVDNMDMDSLVQYAQEQLANYFDKCSDIELKEDIDNYDEELWEELVDNVTSQSLEVK